MLRNRNFLFLWLVNVATTFGFELFTVTILVIVFQQTESTLLTAGTMVARTLPAFLLGPLAGVLVDRFSRKNVLIMMDIVRLILVAVSILFLQGDGDKSILGIYLIIVGFSIADVFHRPARISLIPTLVPLQHLVRANSIILVSSQIMLAISYTVGGWLILVAPIEQIAIGIILLFALSILMAVLIRVPKQSTGKKSEVKPSMWTSFVSGLQYLRQHPIARPLAIMETVEHLPHGIWTGAIMLAFTTQALDGTTTEWGYQITGYFSGMIVGSLIAMTITHWLQLYPGRIIVASASITGIMTLAFASSTSVNMAVVIAFVFGPPFAIRDVAQDSLLQSTVDKGHLGRVYATREMLRNMVFMFAGLFFAWLSDFVPIRIIYVTGGVLYMMTGLYALNNKALRQSKMLLGTEGV